MGLLLLGIPLIILLSWDLIMWAIAPARRRPYKNKPNPFEDIWGDEWNDRLQSYEKDGPWNTPD